MLYNSVHAIFFSTALTLGVLAIALLSMLRGAGRSIPGLSTFASAHLLGMCASALLSLGGILPLAAATAAGYLSFLLSAGLYASAICSFDGKPLPRPFLTTLAVLFLLGLYFAYSPYQATLIIPLAHAAMSFLTFYCGWKLHASRPRPGFNRLFCAAGFYAAAIISAWRSVAVYADPSILMLPNPTTTSYLFIGFSMAESIFGLGFIMMAHERIARRLVHIATHDPLTGARTRGYFMDRARATVQVARDRRRHASILIADLDHFKRINDAYGHQAGDRALCRFVKAAQSALREGDFLARYGGEEFVALLPDTTLHEAIAIAERVRANVQGSAPQGPPGGPLVTVSIGVATTEQGCFDLDALINAADQALYVSKANGRNRVTLASGQAVPARPAASIH